jgi:ketosteroid isomerase-like protein
MAGDENIKTIQRVYEAFGRGDLGTILDALTDDVDWAADTSTSSAPWYGPRKGKDAVTAFFESFGATMEVDEFTPLTFAANDTEVFSIVRIRTRSRANGKPVAMNLHHWFVFTDGKISFYRGTEDTAQVQAVLAG